MKDQTFRSLHVLYLTVLTFAVKIVSAQTASFTVPNPACGGQPVTITNTSVGGSNFYWNYCSSGIDLNASSVNLGNVGGILSTPTYIKCVQDGVNYYAFVANHMTGNIIRLSFGNSLRNTPTVYNLGRIGGLLPITHQGFQIVKDNGNWYGFSVGGDGQNHPSCIARIDFGPSLLNNTPTAVNLGNPGNMLGFPTDIKLFKEGSNWLAFIASIQPNGPNSGTGANTITRLNFGSSLTNATPLPFSLGSVGGIYYPTAICEVKENGNWYFIICNMDIHSFTRLDFGTSLLNIPTGTNLGNPGGLLNAPRDMQLLRTCDGLYGYVVNAHSSPNNVVRLQFAGGTITGALTATDLGGMGGLNNVHPMSDFLRTGDTLYSFVPNASGSTLTRLALASCTNAGIPSSSSVSPPQVLFSGTNTTHQINLLMDEGLPTQTAYCAKVVTTTPVIDSVTTVHPATCGGTDGSLILHTNMLNISGGIYYVQNNNAGVIRQPVTTDASGNVTLGNLVSGTYDSLRFIYAPCESAPVGPFVLSGPVAVNFAIEAYPSSNACTGDTVLLTHSGAFVNPVYTWSTGANTPLIKVTQSDNYWLEIIDGQCSGRDTLKVIFSPRPIINAGKDTIICAGDSCQIGNIVADATYLWNTGSTEPIITVSKTGTYRIEIKRGGCTIADTVTIGVAPLPNVNLGPDGDICEQQIIVLNAYYENSRYQWNTADTTSTLTISEPGVYSVSVTSLYGCKSGDTIRLAYHPLPEVLLGKDTTVCEETPLTLKSVHMINEEEVRWSTGSMDREISITEGGIYVLHVKNICGIASDTILIRKIFCDIWIPNAFTPNGDGVNDVFRVLGNIGRLETFGLSIYNRWGERIFHTSDRYKGWDGRYRGGDVQLGTYIYTLEYYLDGNPVLQKGDFHLLR